MSDEAVLAAVVSEPVHERVDAASDLETAVQSDQADKLKSLIVIEKQDSDDRRPSDASSDLSSSFSSQSSDDEDGQGSYMDQKELQQDLPSRLELETDLKKLGAAAFLRTYLHARKYTAAEMLVALQVPIPRDGKLDLLQFLCTHLATTCPSDHTDSLTDAVRMIQSARKIMVITGAGISTSLGIPDFRSEHGIYSQLEKYNLFDPQEMFDIDLFHHDPSIFYDFCKQLIPATHGRYSPTHAFIRLLQDRGRLLRLYTQNIDNIESHAGITEVNLVQCHGSFRTFSCVTCGHQVPGDAAIFASIKAGIIPKCTLCWPQPSVVHKSSSVHDTQRSGKKRKRAWSDDASDDDDGDDSDNHDNASFGVMKPDMTFFGEQLPSRFKTQISQDRMDVDLIICIGTSLKVAPVAAIPRVIHPSVPQIFISREAATKDYIFDVELLGACDDIVTTMAQQAGWTSDLADLVKHGAE